ncbi:transporter [Acidianus sp. RZ1]|uniref:transporter n=1 Tax=Acidianus sp. RZ1 TaxID=1540082 RepID=UPI00149109B6|nr:transporter [Acidianus sp. RZ1]NON62820.1 transporter [Acidianus sp. RZ1]
MSIKKVSNSWINTLAPLITYALATFILVLPSFTVTQFSLPEWLSFLIVSIPFGGRVVGSIMYQRIVSLIGSRSTFAISMALLGSLSLASTVRDVMLLIIVRLAVGIAFGIATSLAVETATRKGSRTLTALTMSGWAFGWIFGAFDYILLKEWYLIAISGIISIPFVLIRNSYEDFKTIKIKTSRPSILSIAAFFLSFEPAFVLQLAPSIVQSSGMEWLIFGYIVSIPMYLLVPSLSSLLGEVRTTMVYTFIASMSGVLFFYFAQVPALIVFTAFGLGINSLAPRIAAMYGANPRTMGTALNSAALGGVIVPVISSFDIRVYASIFTVSSLCLLAVMALKKRNYIELLS